MLESIAAGLISSAIGKGAAKSYADIYSRFGKDDTPESLLLTKFEEEIEQNDRIPQEQIDWSAIQSRPDYEDWTITEIEPAIEKTTQIIQEENLQCEISEEELRSAIADSFNSALDSFIKNASGTELADAFEIQSNIEILSRLEDTQAKIESLISANRHNRYYDIYSPEDVEEIKRAIYARGGIETEPRFVNRPEINGISNPQKLLVVGRKGSGKTRTLAELAERFCDSNDLNQVVIPTNALTNSEDIQPLLNEKFTGNTLIVWDDIHDLSPSSNNEIFREAILKVEEEWGTDQTFLSVLASARAEEIHQLPNFENKDDRLWNDFTELELKPLARSMVTMLLESGLSAYNLTAAYDVREQFIETVIDTDPSPFYIFSVLAIAANQGDELTLEIINSLPENALKIWQNQYQRMISHNSDSRFVLWSIRLLTICRIPLYSPLIRGVYSKVFGRNKYGFRDVIDDLLEAQWIGTASENSVGPDTYYRIHDIQIEAIDENLSNCLSDFSDYVLQVPKEHLPKEGSLKAQLNHNLGVILINQFSQEYVERVENHYLKAIDERPDYIQARVNYGTLLSQYKELDQAKNQLEIALQLDEDHPEAHSTYAEILLESGKKSRAEKHYQKALNLNPYQPTAHHNYAELLIYKNEFENAEHHLQTAIQLDPNNAKTRNSLGNLYKSTGELEKAEQEFRTALDLRPNYGTAMINLGELFSDQDKLEKAEKYLRRGVQYSNNQKVGGLHNLCTLLTNQGRLEEAKEYAKEALSIDPSFKNIHNTLGLVYLQEGQNKLAIDHYLTALEIDPNYTIPRRNLKQLYQNKSLETLGNDIQRQARSGSEIRGLLLEEVFMSLCFERRDYRTAITRCERILSDSDWNRIAESYRYCWDIYKFFLDIYLEGLNRFGG